MGLEDPFQDGALTWLLAGSLISSQQSSFHDVATGFSRASGPKAREGTAGSHSALCDQVSEAAHCHFCFILLVTSMSLSLAHTQGEGNWAPPPEGKIREFVDIF